MLQLTYTLPTPPLAPSQIEKWQEQPPAKIVKPLPRPDADARKRRGGKRYRKMKERYGLTGEETSCAIGPVSCTVGQRCTIGQSCTIGLMTTYAAIPHDTVPVAALRTRSRLPCPRMLPITAEFHKSLFTLPMPPCTADDRRDPEAGQPRQVQRGRGRDPGRG